jgi:SAM-dependent methyltransferase
MSQMENVNDYGIVADLYDVYVPATDDIPFFVNESQKCSGEVLELMAGTGRVSLPLIEAGITLTCVDISGELLAILRDKLAQRSLAADIYQADVCELDLGKQFDLVLIPFNSFAHLVSSEDQRRALERIRQHLTPNGRLILTLGNPTKRRASVDGKLRLFRKYSRGDGQGTLLLWLLENFSSTDDRVVEMSEFFEEYDARGILQSKRLMELRFRLTTKEEFEELAKLASFEVTALYGDYAYSEFREDSNAMMIWVLRKN